MKSVQKRLSLEEVAELFDAFSHSKLSLAEFARQRHIPYPTLIHYKNRLIQAGRFPIQNTSPSSQKPPAFLQVFPLSSPSRLSLRCGPFELAISDDFNPLLLNQVLEVLKHHV
jgi:hypothetical protein